jgi:hypothetical protein
MKVEFNDEQRRLLANLGQFYDAWIAAERSLLDLPPGRLTPVSQSIESDPID